MTQPLSLPVLVAVPALFLVHAALWAGAPPVAPAMALRLLSWAGVTAIIPLLVTRVEQLPLASIGLQPPGWRTLFSGLALFVVAFLVAGMTARGLMPALGLTSDTGRIAAIAALPLLLQLGMFATAAVTEELVFRGFLMSRLLPLSPVVAVAASVILFTLPHALTWRPAQLVFVAPLGLVFALFFAWRRDLPACILAHFLVDTAGFMMMRLHR